MKATFPVESLVGGVSQQPDNVRLPSQCEELINGIPSVVEGIKLRGPSEWVATLDGTGTASGSARMWAIHRDKDEKYLVVFDGEKLRVFGYDGTEYGIYNSLGITPADFQYLAATDPKDIKLLNVADYTFVLNTTRGVSKANDLRDEEDTEIGHAYVSVVQGAYSTNYTIKMDPLVGSYPPETYTVRTWDGTSAASATKSRYQIGFRVGDIGNNGEDWTLSYEKRDGTTQTITKTVNSGGAEVLAKAFFDNLTANGTLKVYGLHLSSGGHWWKFDVEATTTLNAANNPWNLNITQVAKPASATDALIVELEGPSVAEIDSIQTKDIAVELAKKINTNSTLFFAVAQDHVIKLTSPASFNLDVADTSNGTLMLACNRQVNAFTELPTRCTDGYGVRVKGNTKGLEDDYWVRFSIATETGLPLGGFGEGTWEEGLPLFAAGTIPGADGFQRSFFKPNMPWSLVRKFTSGGAVYFVWEQPDWADREVGDLVMNPFPDFVGRKISDIVFHRNRLGLVAGPAITFSEAGAYFNFWRTTVRQLLDSDPVSLASNLKEVLAFSNAVEVDGDLLLVSDRTVVRLEADPVLTPSTGVLRPVLRLQLSGGPAPVVVGRTVMAPTGRGEYTGIYELFRADDTNYAYYDITEQAPHYIFGSLKEITSCPQEGQVVLLADDGQLYLHTYFFSGNEKVQAAWSKIDLADGDVLGAAFIEADLFLLVLRGGTYDLERISFATGVLDGDQPGQVHLDRRFSSSVTDVSYNPTTDLTSIALPYYADPSSAFEIVRRDTWAPVPIDSEDLTEPGSQYLYLAGDQTSVPMWIGLGYEMEWRIGRVMVREGNSRGGSRGILSGRTAILSGTLALRGSGAATVVVEHQFNEDDVYNWWGMPVGQGFTFVGNAFVGDDTFRFPVAGRSEDVAVVVRTDSYLPLALVGLEWEVDYNAKTTRYRG